MDAKKMVMGLLLIAAFALPALASFETDVITPETVRAILSKTSPNSDAMLTSQAITTLTGKTVVSQTMFAEALLGKADHGVNGLIPCGESCVWIPCFSAAIGCSCNGQDHVCYRNSLPDHHLPTLASLEKDVITHEAVEAALQKTSPNSNIKLSEEAITALTGKTLVSKTIFEEALLSNVHRGGVNGFPCGESCVYIPCTVTALWGCACWEHVCYTNSLPIA